jgi:hypothetical protein
MSYNNVWLMSIRTGSDNRYTIKPFFDGVIIALRYIFLTAAESRSCSEQIRPNEHIPLLSKLGKCPLLQRPLIDQMGAFSLYHRSDGRTDSAFDETVNRRHPKQYDQIEFGMPTESKLELCKFDDVQQISSTRAYNFVNSKLSFFTQLTNDLETKCK